MKVFLVADKKVFDTMEVKILEMFGPSKFSVRPSQLEGSFHELQLKLDRHFESAPAEVGITADLVEGDNVRFVVRHIFLLNILLMQHQTPESLVSGHSIQQS